MPIFISYSQKDSSFVDALARNLVHRRHHIWMDRWELKVGDSLIERIQSALTGSSAVLVILSKNSVESEWCKKELNATLMRELAEKKALLMPCVIDDCEIPLFLREKLYADFRHDPDKGLKDVERALAGITNPLQGREETPNWHTDWSVSWGTVADDTKAWGIELTYVDHGPSVPYSIMSQCLIECDPPASRRFATALKDGKEEFFIREVTQLVVDSLDRKQMTIVIDGPRSKNVSWNISGKRGENFTVRLSCRRLGTDNGMDTIYYMDNNLHLSLKHMQNAFMSEQKSF
ncbi:TIR domain-containing protein [Tardiphaga sp. 1201_B9_N1_1]|uniref:TIR domain-containing protein n=1 Tax=unclassified Tardiphaga TaxID=2631404 RepID=UPI003F259D4A